MSKILYFVIKVITLGIIDVLKKKAREEVNDDGQETSDVPQKK